MNQTDIYEGYAYGNSSVYIWPVSYTHLDVYKRQVQSSAPSLANAGLDDLLSMGGSSVAGGTRKAKRNTRRGHINVFDKK